MNNIKSEKKKSGLFMFFVIGLFMLQIVFAFTIHGDIGQRTDMIPGLENPASPVLIGKIDSLVSNSPAFNATKVVPEGAFSPAEKKIPNFLSSAKVDTEVYLPNQKNCVRKANDSRFYEYRVQTGDSIAKIAKRLYGTPRMIQALIRINRVTNEKGLRVGSVLKVPHTGLLKTVNII